MKNLFTLVLSTLFTFTAIAQMDDDKFSSKNRAISLQTPALKALYEEAEILYENGTAAQINANRLAIKNEWISINPAIGALYKPINTQQKAVFGQGSMHLSIQDIEQQNPLSTNRDWGGDILIHNDFVDGVDMDVTQNTGDIYIGMYENDMNGGDPIDEIFIYRSENNGASWELFTTNTIVGRTIVKMQLISIDGTGDNYILAYLLLDNGLFQVARWNMTNGDFEEQSIRSGVSDFSVDRSFQDATSSVVVLATYLVDNGGACSTETVSARSTAGSYGFDWVDEVSFGFCGEQIDFTYARAGDAFVTYTEAGTGNLYAHSNNNLNDPISWSGFEVVALGASRETLNPIIRAIRRPIGTERVIIWTSSRTAGSDENYNAPLYLRENGGPFALSVTLLSKSIDWNIAHTDSWVRREIDNGVIRMSYLHDNINNSENDYNRSAIHGGDGLDSQESVADESLDVFDGFPSAIAETADNEPCMVFAGTNGDRGFGLYFDTRADLLAIEDNQIEGLSYYPNPTNDSMTVSAVSEISSITVYTMLGKPVLKIKPNNNKVALQTANLIPGVYIMKVTSGKRTSSFKILKSSFN